MVLAKACGSGQEGGPMTTGDNELKPLIYPLVQVTLGALK